MKRYTGLWALWDGALLWYEKDGDHMAAMVSYYTLFAIVPTILLTTTVGGWVLGKEVISAHLLEWGSVLGPDLLQLLRGATANLESSVAHNFSIPLLGVVFFLGMVIVVFNTFASGLHQLWDIPHRGFVGWLLKSRNSILFLILLEVYLIVLMMLQFGFSSVLGELWSFFGVVRFVLFIFATTILFNFMYYLLPWQSPALKARLFGALVASVLFALAKVLVAYYVSLTPVPSLFEAAGILIVFMIWVYATVCILYYGAAVAHCFGQQSDKLRYTVNN